MKKQRLIRAWLKLLDADLLKLVEANIERQRRSRVYDIPEYSLADAILTAFEWHLSAEGFDFWNREHDKIIELHGY